MVYALLSSQPILNDEQLFAPMYGALHDEVNNALNTVFQEYGEKEFLIDDESRLVGNICLLFFMLLFSSSHLALFLLMKRIRFHLEKQFKIHGPR